MTLAACAEIVRKGDPDRFLAAMAAPPTARARLFPLYAFNVEVARAPWVTAEPMIAEMRLQWWRDALEEIGARKPPRAHEVAAPLADVIAAAGIAPATLDALVAARRRDIERAPFEEEADFVAYLEATGGSLMWATARALGADPEEETRIRGVGTAQALANWFRAIPELEARGRVPLVDGRPEAIARLAEEEGLARLRAARARAMGKAVPALRAAWLADPVLRRAKASPGRVADGTLAPSEFRRRASLIGKAALGRW